VSKPMLSTALPDEASRLEFPPASSTPVSSLEWAADGVKPVSRQVRPEIERFRTSVNRFERLARPARAWQYCPCPVSSSVR
jgi:hypothetical protein